MFFGTLNGRRYAYELPIESGITKQNFFEKANSYNHNPRQRVELQGQPRFNHLVGPMFNGYVYDIIACEEIPVIRYETTEYYNSMD